MRRRRVDLFLSILLQVLVTKLAHERKRRQLRGLPQPRLDLTRGLVLKIVVQSRDNPRQYELQTIGRTSSLTRGSTSAFIFS